MAVLSCRNRVLAEGKIGADLGVEFNGKKTSSQFVVSIE